MPFFHTTLKPPVTSDPDGGVPESARLNWIDQELDKAVPGISADAKALAKVRFVVGDDVDKFLAHELERDFTLWLIEPMHRFQGQRPWSIEGTLEHEAIEQAEPDVIARFHKVERRNLEEVMKIPGVREHIRGLWNKFFEEMKGQARFLRGRDGDVAGSSIAPTDADELLRYYKMQFWGLEHGKTQVNLADEEPLYQFRNWIASASLS